MVAPAYIFDDLGWSIWERNVYPPFLTLIPGGSKELVGWVQTAQGVTALVAAPLFGVLMDKTSVNTMKYLVALIGLGVLVTVAAKPVPRPCAQRRERASLSAEKAT